MLGEREAHAVLPVREEQDGLAGVVVDLGFSREVAATPLSL